MTSQVMKFKVKGHGTVCDHVCVLVLVCVRLRVCVFRVTPRVLYLAAVGPGSPLGRPVSDQSFGLRDEWVRREGGDLNHVGVVLLNVGGVLNFSRAGTELFLSSLFRVVALVFCKKKVL